MLKYLNGINQQNPNIMNDYELTEMGKIKLPKIKVPPAIKKVADKAVSKLPPKAQVAVNKVTAQIKQAGANIKSATTKMNIATIPLAPARTAFLALVSLNALKLASKLADAENKAPGKIQAMWKKFGGDWAVLKLRINKASKTSKLSGSSLGDGGATAAFIASATPILVAINKLLKELKVKGSEDTELDEAIETGKDELNNNEDVTKTKGVDIADGSSGVIVSRPTGSGEASSTESTSTESTSKNYLPLIIGAGALGVFLLMGKKK